MSASENIVVVDRPRFSVEGEEQAQLASDLLSLEILHDEQGLSTLQAKFVNWDGSAYRYFDGQILRLGRAIKVSGGDEDNEVVMFAGAISALGARYDAAGAPQLVLRAEDAGQLLRLGQRSRVFEHFSDEDVARRTAGDHGLHLEGGVEGPTHRRVWQVNQTDLALLRQRARAVDARLVFADRALRFESRRADAGPPITLTRLRELTSFEASADLAHQRTEVHVHGWSVSDKDGIHATAGRAEVDAEGSGGRSGPELLEELGWDAVEHHHVEVPSTEEEARALATSMIRRRARRFLTGRGVTSGTPGLRVGTKVELLDLGPWFSGAWSVASVRHTFDQRVGLRTYFVCERVDMGGAE